MLTALGEIVRYRSLLRDLVARDLKVRYKRSILGVAWTMLNPLLMMAVLTFVFSQLFRADVRHYAVYLLSAQLIWTFLAQTTTQAMNHLAWGSALITKIYLPRSVFAVSQVGTGLVNLVLALVPLFLITLLTGAPVTWAVLWLPVSMLLMACFALGVGLLLPFYGGEAFGLHAIGQRALAERSADLVSMADEVRSGAGLLMFLAGLILLAVGAILAALAVWRSRRLPKWSGVPFAVAFALYIPQFFGSQPIRIGHGLLVAAGCMWLAVAMWRAQRRSDIRG